MLRTSASLRDPNKVLPGTETLPGSAATLAIFLSLQLAQLDGTSVFASRQRIVKQNRSHIQRRTLSMQ